jgi:hypothetical protein
MNLLKNMLFECKVFEKPLQLRDVNEREANVKDIQLMN